MGILSTLFQSIVQPSPSLFTQPFVPLTPLAAASSANGLAASDFMNINLKAHETQPETPFRSSSTIDERSPSLEFPSSQKRKISPSRPLSSPVPSSSKGKGRAISPQRPSKFARMNDTSPHYSSQLASPQSSHHRNTGPSRSEGELFKRGADESMLFYVQIETRNRGDIVHAIRKNGGKIVSDIPQADVVILAPHSKPFPDWLKRADQVDKPAVQASYVNACIEKGVVLDVDAYLFPEMADKPKRGRPPKSSQKVANPDKKKSNGKPASKAETSKGQVQAKPQSAENALHDLEFEERTPSPPRNIAAWRGNKNLYTTEDRDYFDRYVQILVLRDPEISVNAIGNRLHAKLPHHTLKSWRSFAGKRTSDIDKWRRKAYISRRKAPSRKTPQRGSPQSSPIPDEANTSSDAAWTTVDRKDFQIITEFLSKGGADDRTDEEVWQVLAQNHPSRTPSEWKEFWDIHGEEINTEVSRLNDLYQAASPAPEPLVADESTDDLTPKMEDC